MTKRKYDAATIISAIIVKIQGRRSCLQSIDKPTSMNNDANIPNEAHNKSSMLNITVAVLDE